MNRKGQLSVEYMILTGFILLAIIIPSAIILFNTASGGVFGSINRQKAQDLGQGLVDSAKQMYYLGIYSKKIVEYDVPTGLEKLFIVKLEKDGKNYYYVVLILGSGSKQQKMYFQSDAPIHAPLSPPSPYIDDTNQASYVPECGASCNFYNFKGPVLKDGFKKFKVETKPVGGEVMVEITPLLD